MVGIIIRLLFFFVLVFFQNGNASDVKSEAKNVFQTFKSTSSSSQVIKQRYVNPLLSNTPMYTIDSSTSFNAQILCPSATEFMTILAQPLSTGDINVIVFLDKNRDGRMDSQFNFNGVSGICANGFIRCDPGKWQACKFYKFFYNGNSLIEREVSFEELGGCFCINNSCGSGLFWRNTHYVLSVLGGAIVQEFQRIDPSFTVSSSVLEGTTLKFYAQSLSNCFTVGGSSQVKSLSDYMENPYTMQGDVSLLYMSESQNPKSVVYSVVQAARAMNEVSEERTCAIRRVIGTRRYDLSELFSGARDCGGSIPGPYVCGETCIYFSFGVYQEYHGGGEAYIDFEMTPDFYERIDSIKAFWRTDTRGPYPCFDDDGYMRFYLNNTYAGGKSYGDSEAKCNCCSSAPQHWVTLSKSLIIPPPSPNSSSMNVLHVVAGGMGGGEGVQAGCRPIRVYFYLNGSFKGCYITNDYVEDTCSSLDNDPQCVLWEEKVDNVVTVQGGAKTGLYPLVKCETFCDKVICGTNWLVERKYKCKNRGIDLSDAERRLEKVYSTSIFDSTTGKIDFTDIRKNEGTWNIYPSQELEISALFYRDTVECEHVCKVEVLEVGKDVRLDMSLKVEPKKIFVYRPCQEEAGRYVCPLSSGEKLVTDCTCYSFFTEATTALQAMRLAGSDFICSTGVEKSF